MFALFLRRNALPIAAVVASLASVAAFAPAADGAAAPAARASARPARATQIRAIRRATPFAARAAATGATLIGDAFSAAATTPNAWLALGNACLTAGTNATPATSIPACGAAAPQDRAGQGALQLTAATQTQAGMVVTSAPLPIGNGLLVSFTDYSFGGSTPGADGVALFFSDGTLAQPTALGSSGGSLGYSSGPAGGIANGYLGVGFDEYGNFSNPIEGRSGGPGPIPETIALRGAASAGYPYLGGALGANNAAASLPFAFDRTAATVRPADAPSVRVTLLPSGLVTVAIDRHDGNGFATYLSQNIVGVAGQPAVPAQVFLGFTSSTGGSFNVHQIGNLHVAPLAAPGTGFMPTQIANLQGWFDASDPTSIATTAASGNKAVGTWRDKSGAHNDVAQAVTAAQPAYGGATIGGLGAVHFGGTAFLSGARAFAPNVFNESTSFVVTNQAVTTQQSSILWSGAYFSDPRWTLRLSEAGVTHFDFNNKEAGRLSVADVPSGPALWTFGGSLANNVQLLRKNGNLIGLQPGPTKAVTGTYPLVIGATATGGTAAYQYAGDVGEVLIYNRALSAAESARVEGYLACKWGLQTRLPANHPYRVACPQGVATTPIPTPVPTGNVVQNPPELRSSNGLLTVNVVASQNATTGAPQLTYGGSTVPPTLRVLPGDTMVVNLTNNLPVPPAGAQYLNDTNLHYHGLHVNPNAPGDDSIDLLAMPGQTLHYQFVVPADHPTGLYWYHSHAHGEAERQNLSGMSGALIVDGIAASAPQVANLPERVLVAREVLPAGQSLPNANRNQVAAMNWAMARGRPRMAAMSGHGSMLMSMDTPVRARTTRLTRDPFVRVDPRFKRFVRPLAASTHCTVAEAAPKLWTIDGAMQPRIGIRPGEKQFWRLVNAGSDGYLDVSVDNAPLQLVALDGVPLTDAGGAPTTMTVGHYVLPPASRMEFVVTGPPAGTTAYLRTACFDAGSAGPAMPAAVLATLDSSSSITDLARYKQRTAPRLARVRARAHTARYITTHAVSGTQTIYYSDQNTINGTAYDPAGPPQFYVQSGTVQEWNVVNNSSQVHTFHIHQIHFVVEAVNGVTAPQQLVLDNVNVPAATANGPGSVKLLLDFTDPSIVGTFLLHCHILSHEDAGMMAKVRVGLAPPMTASSTSVSFASASAAAQTVTIGGGTAPYSVTGCANVANATLGANGVTISPTGAGSCVLLVSDASGLSVSIQVAVQGAVSPINVSPNSLSFASPGLAAQVATIAGGTAPYGVAGCSGIANASVNATSLSVAPVGAGSCTLTVTDAANFSGTVAVTVAAATGGTPLDNLTFHQNNARSGWYRAETTLSVATVASASFGRKAMLTAPAGMPAFGKVFAQPLVVTQQATADGATHDLVIVATSTDQVYAFDDATRTVVWHRDFTNPGAGIRQQLASDTGCNDVNPDVGIIGTPVIDRTLGVMYVVVPTVESGTPHMRLHAITLAAGVDAIAPREVAGTVTLATGGTAAIDALHNFARSALLEVNGNVYVSLGSHCDYAANVTHGWIVAYTANALAPAGNIVDLTNANSGGNYYLGSPWMSGYGPAADAAGNLYFATGNGPLDGRSNFSMSVVRVPGTLDMSKADYFAPASWQNDSNADQDLGSGGVMLFPDQAGTYPHLLVGGGKSGATGSQKYLLNRDHLGGISAGDAGAIWHADTGGGIWGGPAYFEDANGTPYVVYGNGSPLNTYALSTSPPALAVQSSANVGCLECRDSGSQPVVSSNGSLAGTAVVWALKTPGNAGGQITLYAFDGLNMSHTLFSGAAGSWLPAASAPYIGGALVSPTVVNGHVYVPTDGAVAVFGVQ